MVTWGSTMFVCTYLYVPCPRYACPGQAIVLCWVFSRQHGKPAISKGRQQMDAATLQATIASCRGSTSDITLMFLGQYHE